jgi:hypothetical protein
MPPSIQTINQQPKQQPKRKSALKTLYINVFVRSVVAPTGLEPFFPMLSRIFDSL